MKGNESTTARRNEELLGETTRERFLKTTGVIFYDLMCLPPARGRRGKIGHIGRKHIMESSLREILISFLQLNDN
jgi:hypothetical protein